MGLVPVSVQTIVETTIERLAHGGDGVARVDGLVVFVPWTAPGDRVRLEIVEQRTNYARGRVESILQPSPCRIEPVCPVFGTCGGCQLQHVSRSAQIEAKMSAVADAIGRIGPGLGTANIEFGGAAEAWGYRGRCLLSWRWDGTAIALGYHPLEDAETIVSTAVCPILDAEIERQIPAVSAAVAAVCREDDGAGTSGRIALRRLPGHEAQAGVFATGAEKARNLAETITSRTGLECTWGGITENGGIRLAGGAPRLERWITYDGLDLRVGFDSFLQADLDSAASVYDAVVELIDVAPGESVIDAYSGIGVTACRLASVGARVTAIEAHPGTASDLRANVARVGALQPVHVLEIEAHRVRWDKPRPRVVVLNPPRGGCPRRVLDGIDRSHAERIVYVSCDPATLARDLKHLAPRWRADTVRVFDLFPQTAHVETVVRLERVAS